MYIIYCLMCLIFGTTFLAIKIGVEAGVPPFLFAGTRFFVAGVVVLLALRLRQGEISLSRANCSDVLLVGVFMTGIMFGCLYWGEQYISSGIAALLAATTPIMIGVVEWWKGQRDNGLIKGSGLLISFGGVAMALFPALGVAVTQEAVLAVAVILLAQVGCVFGTLRSKRVLMSGVNPFLLNGWQMLTGGTMLLLLSLAVETVDGGVSEAAVLSWLYLVVFGSLAGHGAYYWLVQRAGPLLPSTWTYISPIIAQFVGYYALAEYVSGYSFIGLGLVLCGVFLVSRGERLKNWLRRKGERAA